MGTIGQCVGIVSEAIKLLYKLGILLHEVGNDGAKGAVQEDNNDIFAVLAYRVGR